MVMAGIRTYRELDAWVLAMDLVEAVVRETRAMPRTEFDLVRQARRAAISIPANLAEGWRRKGRRQAYQNHVSIAMGSHGELGTHLEICFRSGFLNRDDCRETLDLLRRVGQLLDRLHDSLAP